MGINRISKTGAGALVAAAVVTAGGLLMTGVGVYAGLNADATGTSSVTSGTLSLTLGKDATSAGFPQTVTNMAPGDTYNTYVTLTNGSGSNLAAQNITLAVTAPSSPLITPPVTDGPTGLTVTIMQCSQAWTVSTAACGASGGASPTAVTGVPVANLSSAASLISGAVTPGAVYHLQVSLTLPTSLNETTTNGVVPTGGIQGQSVTLTYTFAETQRAGTVTNG